MNIAVIGVGHVGLVTAAALARWGHDVVGCDDDHQRIQLLSDGGVPFHEPDLPEVLAEATGAGRADPGGDGRANGSGRLRFTADKAEAVADAEVVFVCVGTPSLPGGGPNLMHVERVGREVATNATHDLVLVEKSTVPANTGVRLTQTIAREQERLGSRVTIDVASNPEFLREGSAVQDTLHPDRIVYGTSSTRAADALRGVYARVVAEDGCPVVATDLATAELIKHASNAFLATRLSFINAVARVCDAVGADVEEVALGMGHDPRIGHAFLKAGLGYGGSCFPKDIDAFIHLARQVGIGFGLLEEVRAINEGQRQVVIDRLRDELWHLSEKTITILGAAFKPGTDDLREAPAIHLARMLIAEGATVRVYDPVALDQVAATLPEVEVVADPLAACDGAHAAVVATEWPEICRLDAVEVRGALAYPIVVDGRNCLDSEAFRAAGIRYHAIGRPDSATRSAPGLQAAT